jgi:hypothetical protein
MIKKLPNLTAAVLASSIFSLSLPSNAQAGVLGVLIWQEPANNKLLSPISALY